MTSQHPSHSQAHLYAVPTEDVGDDLSAWAPDDAPAGPWTLDGAYRYCERLANDHYENFPVASRFVPGELRRHVWAIYAFARTADDFSDEPRFEGQRRVCLDRWERLLDLAYRQDVDHPVFLSLRDTVRTHQIPLTPFKALLTAFRMDLSQRNFSTFVELRKYCEFSANPVGQLVLYVHGYREPDLHRFSNEICTGLQLANMLQDLSIDIPRGRTYLPIEDLVHFGVRESDLEAGRHTPEFKELMRYSVARCRSLFLRGQPLIRRVRASLSMELEATWRGGMKILDRIEDRDFEVLDHRPTLERRDVADIAMRSLFSFGRRMIRGR